MLNKKEVSLAEEKYFGSSLLEISRKYNLRNSWKHPGNSRKDKKNAEGKGPEIVRLAEATW